VEATSEPGAGTVFRVYLPRIDARAEAIHDRAVSDEPPGGTEVILLVEDERQVRDVAARMLGYLGYEVLSADSGSAALDCSRQHAGAIDLLLTDVIMPQQNGKQLAERLVQERPGLRVLYMSGHTDDSIAHHGVLDAGVELIRKPFTHQELATRVRQRLDS